MSSASWVLLHAILVAARWGPASKPAIPAKAETQRGLPPTATALCMPPRTQQDGERAVKPVPAAMAYAGSCQAKEVGMHKLRTDAARLWDSLMTTAQVGATAKGGICRLTLTDLDRKVRAWLQAQVEALGCTVTCDDMGVMFALRAGSRAEVPPIAIGSHMDTQPTGG